MIDPAPHRGQAVRSSRAWPTYRFPASVETPIAAANSVIANSATNGAPAPATGIPVSPYRPSQIVAASSIESTECIAAHGTAACNRFGLRVVCDPPLIAREGDHRTCGVEL